MAELKKLKGQSVKTSIGQMTLRQYYRLDNSQFDQIYFKTSGIQSICKVYDLAQQASNQRFRNEMQQYLARPLSMIYDKVHCQSVKIKKADYGLVIFMKIDKEQSLLQCMGTLSGYDRMKLTQTLVQLLCQLKEKNKIYCNIRPSNIYKISDKFVIINSQFLRSSALRNDMDSFMLETIENNWKYWPSQIIDTYSNQPFDYTLDIYAVGCILYQLISGKYPFESKLGALNGQYSKLENKNFISKIAELFLTKSENRKNLDLLSLVNKLKQSAVNLKGSQVKSANQEKFIRKGSNNGGIFDNISNVFSKMMNDSEGWFLNYVEDNEDAPNQKYIDNILTKMYKKQQKSQKLSGIISKYVGNSSNKRHSMLKTLLLIGQVIRKGPEVALASLYPNLTSMKQILREVKEVQSLCYVLEKKFQVNQKVKKTMGGNFYLYQLNKFKDVGVLDLKNMVSYLQVLIHFVQKLPHADISDLSQSITNFACDEIYDIVSMIIFSLISIRKDNQIQLRTDKLKQLDPLERSVNTCLKKLSNLSNFISAHAIYSLEAEYLPYQQQITLRSNPYYTTLEHFYNSCRNYKGLSIPVDYCSVFNGNTSREEKKTTLSTHKEVKNGANQINSIFDKNYFREQVESEEEDDFSKSYKSKLAQSKDQNTIQTKEATGSQKAESVQKSNQPFKDFCYGENNRSRKEPIFSFEQFGKIHKPKPTSPSKDFNQFLNFNEKKTGLEKPKLPLNLNAINKKNVVDFDEIFNQGKKDTKKQTRNDSKGEVKNRKNTSQPNFDMFSSFLCQTPKANTQVAQIESPLVTKILGGLKLKQLKDLLIKNKKFIIQFSELKLIKVIGSGSAGQVYYGKYNEEQVAIKKVKAKENLNALKQFQRELVTYIKIKKNPYLVSLIGLSQSNGDFFLITEFCSSGSLFDLLHKRKIDIVLSWKERLAFAIQIAEGMLFLHSMKPIIIHRDLKSLNVFVTKVENKWKMKVADFGLSRSPQSDMMTTQLGTIHWMAPELLEGKQYSYKVDVYSYGILLWQILTRTTPYSNLKNPMAILKYVAIDKLRPSSEFIPKECPQQLINIMEKCWAHEVNDRPPFSKILEQLKAINL